MALIAGPIQTSGYQAPDYSPVIDASLRGGMLQQQITQGAIGQVTDYFKQQGEKKKLIKQSDVQIDAALKLFPDLAPTLQGVRDQIRDENVPLNDRAAIAESVAGLINMGTNQMRFQAQQQLQQAELEARSAPSVMSAMPKPTTYKPSTIDVGGQKLYVTVGSDGYYYDPQTKTPILDLEAYARGESPEVYGGGAGMSGAEFLTEADMMLPQDGGAALMDGGVLPPPPVDSQQAAGIQSALGYSPQLAGGLPPGVEGPVIPDLTSPSASPEQIQAALDAVSPQAAALAPAQPQAQGQLRSRLIGQQEASKGTVMTQEQVQDLTSRGFKVSGVPSSSGGILVTGVQSLAPQKGQETIVNPDGTVTIRDIVTGGKQQGIQQAQEELAQQNIRIMSTATDQAFSLLDQVGTNNPLAAAGSSVLAKVLPATDTGELQRVFERINGENSFERMQTLRASSPTGGAAGSMTEKEWPRFEARFFPLDVNAKRDTLEKALRLNMLNAFEAANGTPDDVIKSLKDKKITQQQFDDYVRNYVTARSVARVNAAGVPGQANDWTKLNKNLLNLSTDYEAPSTESLITPEAQGVLDKYRQ